MELVLKISDVIRIKDLALKYFEFANANILPTITCNLNIALFDSQSRVALFNAPNRVTFFIGSVIASELVYNPDKKYRKDVYYNSETIWSITHELFHCKQDINLNRYQGDTSYADVKEKEVEYQTYQFLTNMHDTIQQRFGIEFDPNVEVNLFYNGSIPPYAEYHGLTNPSPDNIIKYYTNLINNVIYQDSDFNRIDHILPNHEKFNNIFIGFVTNTGVEYAHPVKYRGMYNSAMQGLCDVLDNTLYRLPKYFTEVFENVQGDTAVITFKITIDDNRKNCLFF